MDGQRDSNRWALRWKRNLIEYWLYKINDPTSSLTSRTSNYSQAPLLDTPKVRFMENACSLNKVSQQTQRTDIFLDLCSPSALKEKLPPRYIKERWNLAKSNKTANWVLNDVNPRFYQGILYFQNIASYDGSPINLSSLWAIRKVVCSVRWFLRNLQKNTMSRYLIPNSRKFHNKYGKYEHKFIFALKCSTVFNASNFIESTDQSVQFCGKILYRFLPESDEKLRK